MFGAGAGRAPKKTGPGKLSLGYVESPDRLPMVATQLFEPHSNIYFPLYPPVRVSVFTQVGVKVGDFHEEVQKLSPHVDANRWGPSRHIVLKGYTQWHLYVV
jgi:hypothetical protein